MKKKITQLPLTYLIFILIFSTYCSVLEAQNKLSDSIVSERIQFIENKLKRDQANTKRWWYGWLTGYGSATIAQGAFYFGSADKSTRQDMALGAATTFLGVAGQYITPLLPGNEPEQLNLLSGNSSLERSNKLIIAEELLNDCAKREELARSWKNHAMCSAVNLSSGLITWLGFNRSVWAGIGNFAFNTAITEAQIWTQPTLARRSYKKYKQHALKDEVNLSYEPEPKWYLGAHPGGIAIKVVF
jgi:hypothetical protein